MKKIETPWARFESWLTPRIPAGFSARREGRNALLWLLLPGGVCLALYGMRFLGAYESLYIWQNGKEFLEPGTLMPEFGQLIQWNRWAVILPLLLTGGIHLDGYADTCDALSSYGDRTKKLEILKDPHCGAFAVIRLCSYFVAYFALCCCVQFTPQVGAVWLLALVLERACSGYAVAAFPLAKNTGLAHTFATAADRTTVRRVLGCLSIVLAVALFALGGGVLVLAAGVALWRYHRVAVKQFGGITGDLAGWFLQKAELYMLAALVFCQWKGFL